MKYRSFKELQEAMSLPGNYTPAPTYIGKHVSFNNDLIELFKSRTKTVIQYQRQVLKYADHIGTVIAKGYSTTTVNFSGIILTIPTEYLTFLD